jgi:hypothetical protein
MIQNRTLRVYFSMTRVRKREFGGGTSSEGVLGLEGHCVCFVEDDEFEGGAVGQGCVWSVGEEPEDLAGTRKGFDLFSDDVDTPFVTCIEFENHLLVVLAVDFTCDGQDCRCLSCSWRSVE